MFSLFTRDTSVTRRELLAAGGVTANRFADSGDPNVPLSPRK